MRGEKLGEGPHDRLELLGACLGLEAEPLPLPQAREDLAQLGLEDDRHGDDQARPEEAQNPDDETERWSF